MYTVLSCVMPFNSEQLEELMKADVATLEDFLKRYSMDDVSRKQVELIVASKLSNAMPVAPDRPLPKQVSSALKKRNMAETFLMVYRTIYRSQLIEHGDPVRAHSNAMQLAEYEVRQMVHLRGKKRRRKSKGARKSKRHRRRRRRKSTSKAVKS